MKRFLILLLCLLICGTTCGCKTTKNNAAETQSVVINLASDNTVNGYRTESDSTVIGGNEVGVVSSNKENDNVSASYCANKNSKVFHKSNCGSVKTMKEENKYISSNRQTLINEGYTPCKRCNP